MTKLPARLSRKAVKNFFDKVPGPKWDYWFRHEKKNGLHELRISGPFKRAYYSGEGIKEWLLTEAVYKPEDFATITYGPPLASAGTGWNGLVVRKHALAG